MMTNRHLKEHICDDKTIPHSLTLMVHYNHNSKSIKERITKLGGWTDGTYLLKDLAHWSLSKISFFVRNMALGYIMMAIICVSSIYANICGGSRSLLPDPPYRLKPLYVPPFSQGRTITLFPPAPLTALIPISTPTMPLQKILTVDKFQKTKYGDYRLVMYMQDSWGTSPAPSFALFNGSRYLVLTLSLFRR